MTMGLSIWPLLAAFWIAASSLKIRVRECRALAATIVVVEPSSLPGLTPASTKAAAQEIADSLGLPLLSPTAMMDAGRRKKHHRRRRTAVDSNEEDLSPDLYLSLEPYSYVDHEDGGATIRDYALSIAQADSTNKQLTKPLAIDFWPPKSHSLRQRRDNQQGGGGDDLLTKAIHPAATVVDATAGLGRDAWLIATSVHAPRVVLVERHPIVAALLRDSLRRLSLIAAATHKNHNGGAANAAAAADLWQRLTLVEMDALDYLITTATTETAAAALPDVVYLDPMFPPRRKSAAVKKNMQILHTLLSSSSSSSATGEELAVIETAAAPRITHHEKEGELLLRAARRVARTKVVVKRPIHAAPIRDDDNNDSPPPSSSITGSINRWDIYATTTTRSGTKTTT